MTLSQFIYEVDKVCRKDLSNQILVSERDYVTQFNSLIRYPNGILGPFINLIHSQTLNGRIEQKIGCDSIMIFKFLNGFKIGVFEAKYPRYISVNRNILYADWDSNNRFNTQLLRQQVLRRKFPKITIWEHFIDNGATGSIKTPFIDSEGSSIILFDDIQSQISSTKWGFQKLKNILSVSGINIETLIDKILAHEVGGFIEPSQNNTILLQAETLESGIEDTSISESEETVEDDLNQSIDEDIYDLRNENSIQIPVLNNDNHDEISLFMKYFGLNNYYLFNIYTEHNN